MLHDRYSPTSYHYVTPKVGQITCHFQVTCLAPLVKAPFLFSLMQKVMHGFTWIFLSFIILELIWIDLHCHLEVTVAPQGHFGITLTETMRHGHSYYRTLIGSLVCVLSNGAILDDLGAYFKVKPGDDNPMFPTWSTIPPWNFGLGRGVRSLSVWLCLLQSVQACKERRLADQQASLHRKLLPTSYNGQK